MLRAARAVHFFLQVMHASRQFQVRALDGFRIQAPIDAGDFAVDAINLVGELLLGRGDLLVKLVEAFTEDIDDIAEH